MNATINGNSFIKIPHLFVPGKGTFFADKETAVRQGTSPNGVGLWFDEFTFEGATWYQAGNLNCWD
jgi:hypothetical protein